MPASERFPTLFWPAFIQFDLFFSTYVYSRSCIIIDFITIITLLRFGLMYNLIGYNKKFWKQKLQCRDKTQGTIHFTKGRLGEASCFSDRNSRRILRILEEFCKKNSGRKNSWLHLMIFKIWKIIFAYCLPPPKKIMISSLKLRFPKTKLNSNYIMIVVS